MEKPPARGRGKFQGGDRPRGNRRMDGPSPCGKSSAARGDGLRHQNSPIWHRLSVAPANMAPKAKPMDRKSMARAYVLMARPPGSRNTPARAGCAGNAGTWGGSASRHALLAGRAADKVICRHRSIGNFKNAVQMAAPRHHHIRHPLRYRDGVSPHLFSKKGLGHIFLRQPSTEFHGRVLPFSLKSCQANFANGALRDQFKVSYNPRMGKKSRIIREPMPTLRAWRESLGLSRQDVANKIGTLVQGGQPVDQATIAKWESGETAVRFTDLKLLAQIYGTSPDRLLFDPGDNLTPDLLKRAHSILVSKDKKAIEAWLSSGEFLPDQR